jgi:hypothetical protein
MPMDEASMAQARTGIGKLRKARCSSTGSGVVMPVRGLRRRHAHAQSAHQRTTGRCMP